MMANIGGAGRSCYNFAPLVMNDDGSATISGQKISSGELTVSGNNVIHQYSYNGLQQEVTYTCNSMPTQKAPDSNKKLISEAVFDLQFPSADGFLGYANSAYLVPYSKCAPFVAGGPQPDYTVGGSAYQTAGSRTMVKASFTRKAMRAGHYCIVLESGQQRINVATVDLRGASGSVQKTIAASLSGESPETKMGRHVASTNQSNSQNDLDKLQNSLSELSAAVKEL